MNEDSFAKMLAREGVFPPTPPSALSARPAPHADSAAVLPPDVGEDSPFADKKMCNIGGADKRILMALRKKPPESSLDLHGLTAKEAHAALDVFLRGQTAAGRRHVEIIHGKGGRGADGKAVLRTKTRKWLSHAGAVLGWAEPPHNSGAVHVLLRREK